MRKYAGKVKFDTLFKRKGQLPLQLTLLNVESDTLFYGVGSCIRVLLR